MALLGSRQGDLPLWHQVSRRPGGRTPRASRRSLPAVRQRLVDLALDGRGRLHGRLRHGQRVARQSGAGGRGGGCTM
ncbi:MAG: hypothetical protein MZV64_04560 [Ignavibacteriales bacterium]|nr:hypothetical protein [Ignavibacteriales bacterium]